MLKKLMIILLISSPLFYLFSQTPYDIHCNTNAVQIPPTPVGIGLSKPMVTPPTDNINSYFRVLMLFVEFQDDYSDPNAYWQPNSLPPYSGQLLAPQKQLGIHAYEQYKMSDFFNKISRDQFDVIGDVYHVILPHIYDYYLHLQQLNGTGFQEAQLDVFRTLDSDPNFPWSRYDLWQWNDNLQQYQQQPDGYIDMIFLQYRHVNMLGITAGGYGGLIYNYTTSAGKLIDGRYIHTKGSGTTGFNGANLTREAIVGL